MIIGIVIAVIAALVGAPIWVAAGAGLGYSVLAFVVTPREFGGFAGRRTDHSSGNQLEVRPNQEN